MENVDGEVERNGESEGMKDGSEMVRGMRAASERFANRKFGSEHKNR